LRTLRIGTRGSRLALVQAAEVVGALRQLFDLELERVVIRTEGDRSPEVPLVGHGTLGFFVADIEEALLEGRIDIAVHSLKDMPTRLPDGLMIAAVTKRLDPRDMVVTQGGGLAQLEAGQVVGTSSLRRAAQLLHLRPDLRVSPLRGNVETRIRKMWQGSYDALILARAGLLRLGLGGLAGQILEPQAFLPAPGQGAVALQVRAGDKEARQAVEALNHHDTSREVNAERSFLAALEGGCQVPIGALARVKGGELHLSGMVASLDGSLVLRDDCRESSGRPEDTGRRLADALLRKGAGEILRCAREAAVS